MWADLGLIPGSGRSPGEGNGNPLQYSCLENPMDGGTWWAIVHGVTKSWTRLSDFTFTFTKAGQAIPLLEYTHTHTHTHTYTLTNTYISFTYTFTKKYVQNCSKHMIHNSSKLELNQMFVKSRPLL